MIYWKLSPRFCAALAFAVSVSTASAQQLNPQQIQIIKDTALSICNTVKEAKGKKSSAQIQGEVNAKLPGLLDKFFDAGVSGKGSLSREEFEGLSQEATGTALMEDQHCRERVFNKMFDKLGSIPNEVTFQVSYELPRRDGLISGDLALQGQAVIYIAGSKTTLSVSSQNRFATSVMKVMQPVRGDSPKDDVYPYRLEVTEVWSATNETPYVYQTQKSGESAINIKEGDGLKIGYGAMFVPSVRAYKQIVTLNKVPRREPKEIKTMKDLEEFLGPDKKAK